MNFDQPQRFPARMTALPELQSLVTSACEQAGFSYEARLRTELAIEELFTNSVQHGYAYDSTQPVWLAITIKPGHIALRYQDAAPAYNPLTAPARSTDLHTTQPGGFGIGLLRGMATTVRYCRENERNTLELEFEANPPAANQ